MIRTIQNLNLYNRKAITIPLIVILGLCIGLISPKAPMIVLAFAILPFVLININFKSYLFFALIVSQIFVGVIVYFVPIHNINFGVIDNAYKALVFTGLSLLMIYTGLKVKKTILKTNYLLCFFLSFIYFMYSSITATNSTDMLYILKFLVPPLFFITITMNYEQINWSKLYKWTKVFILVNLLFCFYQVFAGSGTSDIARGSGLTPSRNTFSMYLVFLFDFILLLSFLLKKDKFSLILLISVVVMEFLSFGRAGWAILGITLILTLLFYKKIKTLILTLGVVSTASYFFWDKISLRIQSGQGTSEHRETVTSLLMSYGEQQPFFGYGFGWAQEFLLRNPDVSQGLIQPHNDFVRFFVDTGLLGLALFTLPFILMIFRSIKLVFNKNKMIRQIAFVSLLAAIQLFVFMKVYNTVDMYYASTMMVWFFMAILEMEYRNIKGEMVLNFNK